MKIRNSSQAGFSLVEVVLALAVVVFCLVSVMGLLTVGVNTSQSSSLQTTATNILHQVAADLQATPVETTISGIRKGSTNQVSPYFSIKVPGTGNGAAPGTMPTPQTLYFTDDGLPTTATDPNVLYQVNIWINSAGSNALVNPTGVEEETFVRLLITWPAKAAITNSLGSVEEVVALNRT